MAETDDAAELLFFDTFSHEVDEDINLDLVQFPKPVFITQVRVIPLGARVQADFPGGVRLGATNPSKFDIEFSVNDLGMPRASTFETLGCLQYNQNDCIHLECTQEKIPTDGLLLRGYYSTITLAVYGILTNTVAEQIASPPPPPSEPAPPVAVSEAVSAATVSVTVPAAPEDNNAKQTWKEPLPGELLHAHKSSMGDFERDELEYAMPRETYQQAEEDRERRRLRKQSHSSDRSVSSRNRTHSESNERDYLRSRSERERVEKSSRDWSRSPDYTRRSRRKRSERSRSDAEDAPHKWPRTPPSTIDSPLRPRSPDGILLDYDNVGGYKSKSRSGYMRSTDDILTTTTTPSGNNIAEDPTAATCANDDDDDETPGTPGEQFEPILSDDELIGDDDESMAAEQTAAEELELELEAAAGAAAQAIEHFDPYKMPVCHFVGDLQTHHSKDLEQLAAICRKFPQQTKCANLTEYKSPATSVDERESFVYISEQLIAQLAYLSQRQRRRNFVLRTYFAQDVRHLAQMFGVLQIALDFEAACLQPQPAFKIRHIKVGVRLSELLGVCAPFVDYMLQVQHFEPFAALFALYQQQFMAMSIKLLILRAIIALLDTRSGLQHFLRSQKLNGYQWLLQHLQQTSLTRTKFALRSLLKKLNLHESLECIHLQCTQLFVLANYCGDVDESYQLLEHSIASLQDALCGNALAYQQPRRFLPVSKKFEVVADKTAQRCFAHALQSYFQLHSLGESLLLLLSNAAGLPVTLLLRCLDLLQSMLQTPVGLAYLVDDCFETTRMLVGVLLGVEELPEEADADVGAIIKKVELVAAAAEDCAKTSKIEIKSEVDSNSSPQSTPNAAISPSATIKAETPTVADDVTETPTLHAPLQHHLQRLGIELAYKVQTCYHLDAISYTSAAAVDYDANKVATHLHALYSQTCNAPGRQHTVAVLGLNNNLHIIMDLIKKEQRLQLQRQLNSPAAKYKSPVLSYAVDMLDCCVRHCERLDYLVEHGTNILELVKGHESLEPSVSAVLQEMSVYVKPLEVNIFVYDNIAPLLEVITKSLEYITTFPGDLIMGLRILRHLAIGSDTQGADTEELKHRYVALQFYAADGVQTLLHILDKMCTFFDQPGLHSPTLITMQGVHCLQIVMPTLQLLREIISFAIQCRDVDFKDMTAIDHLMRTYCLMYYFPESPAAADATEARREIIQLLLAYTQPNEQNADLLHKSLWTQMVREVIKNVLNGPSTYLPGLQVLAELLPLPLPLPASVQLQPTETQRLITERKLWSAHLHPQSAQLARLIETIAPTSYVPLSDLLQRVCLQLADLAPNMTLLISKTLIDLLCAEWTSAAHVPTPHLLRLLQFFAQLTPYAVVKSSALSILDGKLWELLQSLLMASDLSALCVKCQSAVHRILDCFLNAEISLVSPQSCTSSAEVNLASALPPKEIIPRIAEAVVTNLMRLEVTHEVAVLAAKNVVTLTEHDITFYYLTQSLKQNRNEFQVWLQKLIDALPTGSCGVLSNMLVLLLRALLSTEESFTSCDTFIPVRTLKLTPNELSQLLGLQRDTDATPAAPEETVAAKSPPPHVLQRLTEALQTASATNETTLLADFKQLSAQLQQPGNEVTSTDNDEDSSSISAEPSLPQAEGIVTQYAARAIYSVFEFSAEQEIQFWQQPPFTTALGDNERIACDLQELANTCLSSDTNLYADCKRVLHLSASPQSNRERTPTAPCFRTRRVEVEPNTGRPEKKLYITPVRGRGYSRPPPSRGDLFRSRPPNTSRPPSLHVDDFQALETRGAQPTGPTGYNKIPPLMRGSRVGRNRGSRISAVASYRKSKPMRTSSPSSWNDGGPPHYRSATSEPVSAHFGGADAHYSAGPPSHFGGRPRGRGSRARSYMR